jgi:thiamine biosynthesis protein ThiC
MMRWGRWPLALMVALLSLSVGWEHTFAAPGTGQDPKSKVIEQSYVTAQRHLKLQNTALTRFGTFADKLATVIATAKAKGKDTSALEQALATFRQKLDAARASWQTANDTLASHAGFDAQGKVTDAATARETLKSARSAMQSAHTTIVGARVELRQALAAFRKANRGVVIPDAPPAPAQP